MNRRIAYLLIFLLAFSAISCHKLRRHYGTKSYEPVDRQVEPKDVALLPGYHIEVVSTGLTYPTAIAFDEAGGIYVTEAGYAYGEIFLPPRLIKIEKDGKHTVIAEGETNGPWTGIAFHNGHFYIAEGGALKGGSIIRVSKTGEIIRLVEGLPSFGDHHTNGPLIKDDYIYFGQGTATNSGVVGKDNYQFGWLARKPQFHDIPCEDITLTGETFETESPLESNKGQEVRTAAYSPYGQHSSAGQVVKGQVPCTGAIMRVPLEGGPVEVVAWGFRNPYGLAEAPDGSVYITENGFDVRGSRPVDGAGDVLWKVTPGTWYGWPDFSAGEPIYNEHYQDQTRVHDPKPLLAKHPNHPPRPAAILSVHSSSNGIDFSRSKAFGFEGHAFIAQFGDMAPDVGSLYQPVGYKIVRVDVKNGTIEDFAVNKGKVNMPASLGEHKGLERPIDVKFDNSGSSLYVVDFGVMQITDEGPAPKKSTGVIWKITKTGL